MANQPRRSYDFGFEPSQSPHHFALLRTRAGNVRVEERFRWDEAEDGDRGDPQTKAELDAYRWERVAETARHAFNQRLRHDGLRAARWKARETLLGPHFGRELVLLFWAVEDADPTLIPNMTANWSGLAPEERWWLYSTINATSAHPTFGKQRGWRRAIKIAFADNPAGDASPSAFLTDQLPLAEELESKRKTRSGKKKSPPKGQLSMMDLEDEQEEQT